MLDVLGSPVDDGHIHPDEVTFRLEGIREATDKQNSCLLTVERQREKMKDSGVNRDDLRQSLYAFDTVWRILNGRTDMRGTETAPRGRHGSHSTGIPLHRRQNPSSEEKGIGYRGQNRLLLGYQGRGEDTCSHFDPKRF